MQSIGIAVRNLIEAKGNWYDGEVEAALAKLQEVLGVTSGDVAGLFFSGHDDKWHTFNETNKFSVILDYINAETGALLVESKSVRNTESRIEILTQIIAQERQALESLLNDPDDEYWCSDDYVQHTVDVCQLLRDVWGYDVHESEAWVNACIKAAPAEICEFNIEQCERKIEQLKAYIPEHKQ